MKRSKNAPKVPSSLWPDVYTMKGQIITSKDFDPVAYKKYVEAIHDWHEQCQGLIEELKKLPPEVLSENE